MMTDTAGAVPTAAGVGSVEAAYQEFMNSIGGMVQTTTHDANQPTVSSHLPSDSTSSALPSSHTVEEDMPRLEHPQPPYELAPENMKSIVEPVTMNVPAPTMTLGSVAAFKIAKPLMKQWRSTALQRPIPQELNSSRNPIEIDLDQDDDRNRIPTSSSSSSSTTTTTTVPVTQPTVDAIATFMQPTAASAIAHPTSSSTFSQLLTNSRNRPFSPSTMPFASYKDQLSTTAPSESQPPTPASSSIHESTFCVLISNIPAKMRTPHLRQFFSKMIEDGRFKVFQGRHRTDDTKPQPAPPRKLNRRFEAIEASVPAPSRSKLRYQYVWKCVVQVRTLKDVQRLQRNYHDVPWVMKGEELQTRCHIKYVPLPKDLFQRNQTALAQATLYPQVPPTASTRSITASSGNLPIDLTIPDDTAIDLTNDSDDAAMMEEQKEMTPLLAMPSHHSIIMPMEQDLKESLENEQEIVAAAREGEFETPPGLPQGNVGTPTATVYANIAQLPSNIFRRLGLKPLWPEKAQTFQFDYGGTAAEQIPERQTTKSSSKSRKRFRETDDDDDESPERRYQQQPDEDSQEEWDREMDQGEQSTAYDSGRGLGKLSHGIRYEDRVDNPWDKGDASGLVTYTDEQYHDSQRGDFDERTTDAWDVDQEAERREQQQRDRQYTHAAASSGHDDTNDDDADGDTLDDEDDHSRLRQLTRADHSRIMSERIARADRAMDEARQAARTKAAEAKLAKETAWTKTRFLEKMMTKMGYQPGQGLGKNNQGRAEPIIPVEKANMRGLGYEKTPTTATTTTHTIVGSPAASSAAAFYRQLDKAKRRKYTKTKNAAKGPDAINSLAAQARRDFSSSDDYSSYPYETNGAAAAASYPSQYAAPQTQEQRAMGSFVVHSTPTQNVNVPSYQQSTTVANARPW